MLDLIRDGWDSAAKSDPLFNILTQHGKNDNRWDESEFYFHGAREIDAALTELRDLIPRYDDALDFGCGVGRLTYALAEHFKRVQGVDISPEMIALAQTDAPCNCEFRTSDESIPYPDGSFDFIYSVIVLQHMPRNYQEVYVKEFIRLLKPDGLAAFQVPEGREEQHHTSHLAMYGCPRDVIVKWVEEAGGSIERCDPSYHSGQGFDGYRYAVKHA